MPAVAIASRRRLRIHIECLARGGAIEHLIRLLIQRLHVDRRLCDLRSCLFQLVEQLSADRVTLRVDLVEPFQSRNRRLIGGHVADDERIEAPSQQPRELTRSRFERHERRTIHQH